MALALVVSLDAVWPSATLYAQPAPAAQPFGAAPTPQPVAAPPTALYGGMQLETRWYGWQILVPVLGGTGALLGIGIASADDDLQAWLAGTASTAYLITGPIVHWVHGRVGIGFASLGINVGGPLLGALLFGAIGEAAGWGNSAFSGGVAGALYVGLPVGAVAAVLVDSIVLAWETVPVVVSAGDSTPTSARRRARSDAHRPEMPTVWPTFQPRPDGAAIGVAGLL